MSSQGEDTNRQSNTHPFRAAGIWSAQANFTLSSKLYLADSRPSWKVFFLWQKIRQPQYNHQNGRNYPHFWPQPCCIQIRISISLSADLRSSRFRDFERWVVAHHSANSGGITSQNAVPYCWNWSNIYMAQVISGFNCQHSCEPPSIPTWGIWFSFQISNSCQLVEAFSSTTLIRDI